MTQLVFALVVSMGAQTISVEHWSGLETCLWYSKRCSFTTDPASASQVDMFSQQGQGDIGLSQDDQSLVNKYL